MAYAKKIAELFGKGRSTITEHLQNIFDENELQEDLVSRDFRHTTQQKKWVRYFFSLGEIKRVVHKASVEKLMNLRKEKGSSIFWGLKDVIK